MSVLSLHKKLEENAGLLIFGILFVSAIGGLVQVLPTVFQSSLQDASVNARVYSAVELTGRDIYIREGCSVCHSQQVRPLIAEVERYGPYSHAGEFVYDRPFLWGSKRTGPDLHRIAGKYSDDWHRIHLIDPRAVVPKSIMPGYPWLAERDVDASEAAPSKLEGLKEIDALIVYLQMLGTFYSSESDMHGMGDGS